MFTVYALYSEKYDKIYIGYTSNIEQRMLAHNELETKGYPLRYMPWKLIYSERFPDKVSSMKREKELKSGKGREFIRSLIA
jgi:putative endonuclease